MPHKVTSGWFRNPPGKLANGVPLHAPDAGPRDTPAASSHHKTDPGTVSVSELILREAALAAQKDADRLASGDVA